MPTIIGLDFYGTQFFKSPTPAVRDIYYGEIKNAIFDELSIRDRVDVALQNMRDNWELDHRVIFKFQGDLEGGNITNSGLEIKKFRIKRRRIDELNSITLTELPFVNNSVIEYIDYTQPNDKLIYSITPIAENEIEGAPNEVHIESNFTGWWVVDKNNNETLGFDKFIGSSHDVETQLVQGRKVIETMSRFPTIYYTPQEYHSFSLSTVIIPSELERSGKSYEKIINNFIKNHIPMIVKSGDGRIFVCDVSNPKLSSPLNTWKNHDYGTLTLDFLEVEDYESFMQR